MPITIKLPTPLRRHADQVKTVEVSALTVGEALQDLITRYPAMRGSLYDEAGEIKPFVRVFVDGKDMADLNGLATPTAEGTVISIVPPVAGA